MGERELNKGARKSINPFLVGINQAKMNRAPKKVTVGEVFQEEESTELEGPKDSHLVFT